MLTSTFILNLVSFKIQFLLKNGGSCKLNPTMGALEMLRSLFYTMQNLYLAFGLAV
jgi:hypothetical protein